MKENITGMMVYYYFVCERKLWYFCHEITMETENEDVLLGKLLDESSYKKNDKHISIDQIINIGGGGHLNIAGAQLEHYSITEAKDVLKQTLQKMLDEGDI